jgi:hypothetical protein
VKLLIVLALLYAIWWMAKRQHAARVAARHRAALSRIDADEARALLGLDGHATLGDVSAAHRRVMARVHPDAGGSAALAARVNAARDLLVVELSAAPLNTDRFRAS